MNSPLPIKNIGKRSAHISRVLFFDPTEIYKRIKIDPYKRSQSVFMDKLFPNKLNGKCRCGCEKELKGRRTSWATKECSKFAYSVWAIISGRTNVIKQFLMIYYGWQCKRCLTSNDIKMDHIVGVKHGGGGCWLSNFQLLCHTCHVDKTNKDFGRKQAKNKSKII